MTDLSYSFGEMYDIIFPPTEIDLLTSIHNGSLMSRPSDDINRSEIKPSPKKKITKRKIINRKKEKVIKQEEEKVIKQEEVIKRIQVRNACVRCRKNKIKCDESKPCYSCTSRGLLCLEGLPRKSKSTKEKINQ